jgi:hypothetical protein
MGGLYPDSRGFSGCRPGKEARVSASNGHPRLLLTSVRWPVGVLLTCWAYIWRVTPLHRREVPGAFPADAPPPLPPAVSLQDVQPPDEGRGAFLRRRYRMDMAEAELGAGALMSRIREDPNQVVPGGLAHFHKVRGDQDAPLTTGDEFAVRMPGPWDGPVRVVETTPTSFRFATLQGHLEAGQIEWRAEDRSEGLRFEIESWSRPGDRFSEIAHHKLRMAKEVQLHMWTSVLERVAKLAGGRPHGGVDIHTVVVD